MLKLLRNLVLAAILLAGALKLLAWYAVGHDADRVTAALAPYAQVKYDGLSAGLDGSVTVNNVTAVQAGSHATYHADTITIETPGLFWLLRHSLLHETDVPPTLSLNASGLKFPTLPWLDTQFFDPVHAAMFAAAGCGASTTFTADDYRRMSAPAASANLRSDYHYQPDSHTLDVNTTLSVPGYSAITLRSDLRPMDLATLSSTQMWDKVRAGQIAVDFTDDGFMHRRNQYCAQRVGVPPNQFIAQHITAVGTLLGEHRVQPSSEVVALYRNLVEHGGQASILSLPRNTLAFTRWQNSSPDDLMRQLNITARYADTPPVMFRLTFTPPPDDDTPASGALSTLPTAIAATTQTVMSPPVSVKTPPSPAVNADTKPNPVATTASVTAPPDAAKPPPTKRSGDNFGLHDLDRVEAKMAPKQALIKTPPPEPVQPAQATVTDAQYASSPPPPPNSTLALVWKPTIERLPPPAPPKVDYDIVDYAALQTMLGRHVRLVTDGDKRIEGYVISADAGSVRVRVGRKDGDAQFDVPRKRIREVQLLRRTPPA